MESFLSMHCSITYFEKKGGNLHFNRLFFFAIESKWKDKPFICFTLLFIEKNHREKKSEMSRSSIADIRHN